MGEIYKGGRESSFENVNPLVAGAGAGAEAGAAAGRGEVREDSFTERLKKTAKQFHRDKNYPAPVMPRMGVVDGEEPPPPVPTIFTSAMPPDTGGGN